MPIFAAITAAALLHGAVLTANEKGRSISVVDTRSWTVRSVPLGIAPHNVQVSADGRFAYVTGMQPMEMPDMPNTDMDDMMPGYLLGFDLTKIGAGPVFSLAVGKHPAHVVADRENRFAYVTVSGEDAVKVVDLAERDVAATIPVGKMPHGARLSPDGSMLYVADMNGGTVSFIDVAQRREVARVPAGEQPVQVAVSPDGKTVYATLGGANAVAAIDVPTRKRRALVNVGPNPAQLYIAPDGRRLYVANQGTPAHPGHTVSVIDTASDAVIATVNVPAGAHGVVVAADGSHVYVTDAFASSLSEIDAKTLRVRSLKIGAGPNGVTLTP